MSYLPTGSERVSGMHTQSLQDFMSTGQKESLAGYLRASSSASGSAKAAALLILFIGGAADKANFPLPVVVACQKR